MVKKLKQMADKKAASASGLFDSALAGAVKDSAQQIWLAGMGAFSKAQAEGGLKGAMNDLRASREPSRGTPTAPLPEGVSETSPLAREAIRNCIVRLARGVDGGRTQIGAPCAT